MRRRRLLRNIAIGLLAIIFLANLIYVWQNEQRSPPETVGYAEFAGPVRVYFELPSGWSTFYSTQHDYTGTIVNEQGRPRLEVSLYFEEQEADVEQTMSSMIAEWEQMAVTDEARQIEQSWLDEEKQFWFGAYQTTDLAPPFSRQPAFDNVVMELDLLQLDYIRVANEYIVHFDFAGLMEDEERLRPLTFSLAEQAVIE